MIARDAMWILAATSILVVSGCALSPTRQAVQDPAEVTVGADVGRPIEIGEELWILSAGLVDPAAENRHVVGPTGDVELPLLGRVRIAGCLTVEAEEKIETFYRTEGWYRNLDIRIVRKRRAAAPQRFRGRAEEAGTTPVQGSTSYP